MNAVELSRNEFAGLLARFEDRAPVKEDFGTFVVHDGSIWIGVDNRFGHCLMMRFKSEADARAFAEGRRGGE